MEADQRSETRGRGQDEFGPRLHEAGYKPASTFLKVSGLFHPDILVEIEATAVT